MRRHGNHFSRSRRVTRRGGGSDVPWGWLLGGLAALGGLAWWVTQIRVGDRVLVDPTKTNPALPAPAGSRGVLTVTAVTGDSVTGTISQARLSDGSVVVLPGPIPGSITVPKSAVTGKA